MAQFFGVTVPFINRVGIRGDSFGEGRSHLSLPLHPDNSNHFGNVHGGAVATLLDVAMASAARSLHPETGVVTVGMTLSYLRGATGDLQATGRVRQAGRSLVFCEGEVTDASGQVVATASGTFKVNRVNRNAGDA